MVSRDLKVPVFRPTPQDCLGSWEAYISKIEPKFREVGICKIVPPKSWRPCRTSRLEEKEVIIRRPIEQKVTGKQGFYQALLLERKEMSLQKEFIPLTQDQDNQPPKDAQPEDLEREFWRSMNRHSPLYGADVEASFFDKSLKTWNMQSLDSLLTRVLKDRIPGVNTPYLYFGMWRSFFGWHSEDMELHSINYLHYGAPKHWYCIPPAHREKFETWVKGLLPDCFRACPEFFRHKELLISPSRLRDASIPFVKVIQYPGEMIVNFPGAYHSGFNTGFNCAESTNFATAAWIKFGAEADCCICRKDTVNIDMRKFIPFADKETQEVIEHNFVSESEDESGSDLGEEDCALNAEMSSESELDCDTSSDFTKSRSGKERMAKPKPSAALQRKRKENTSPASTSRGAKHALQPAQPKDAAMAATKPMQVKQASAVQSDSRQTTTSHPVQQAKRMSRLSHLRNGTGQQADTDLNLRRSKRLRHEEPESPSKPKRPRKETFASYQAKSSSGCGLGASAESMQQRPRSGASSSMKHCSATESNGEGSSATITVHCAAGTPRQDPSSQAAGQDSSLQVTCGGVESQPGVICKRLFKAKT